MKKNVLIMNLFLIFRIGLIHAQVYTNHAYEFTVSVEHDISLVQDQSLSSTCWSFSVLSLLETQFMENGKGKFNFSEMYIVYYTYVEKAIKYLRMHGNMSFTGGGALDDVINIIDKYGIVPETEYPGKMYEYMFHNHSAMDRELKQYMDQIIDNEELIKNNTWMKGYKNIIDKHLGKIPNTFTYNSQKYSPLSFRDFLGINKDDYVLVTSFSHHPFYESFILEVPDNWAWGEACNVTIDDMVTIFNYALKNGHTIAWATDVSEKGFSWKEGLAIVPDFNQVTGAIDESIIFRSPVMELDITQEMRQEAFDNYTTTDDHGMHVIGMATDQNGKEYYRVKNSWGTSENCYKGFIFASQAFVKYKTTSFFVHKDGIPEEIKKKLDL